MYVCVWLIVSQSIQDLSLGLIVTGLFFSRYTFLNILHGLLSENGCYWINTFKHRWNCFSFVSFNQIVKFIKICILIDPNVSFIRHIYVFINMLNVYISCIVVIEQSINESFTVKSWVARIQSISILQSLVILVGSCIVFERPMLLIELYNVWWTNVKRSTFKSPKIAIIVDKSLALSTDHENCC